MKKLTLMIAAVAISGVIPVQAADRDERNRQSSEVRRAAADLDKRITALNKLDNDPKAFQAGLSAVSKETAVPLPTIEAEHKQHPRVGLAGLFMAYEISVKSKKSVDSLVKQRTDGKTWTQLARANNLDLNELETKLSRIETAMRGGSATASTSSSDRTQVRESDSKQTAFDKRLESLSSLDDQPLAMRTGLAAVSKETAVPLTQLEELQKQHTSASVGDLFIAQELATKTQKPASDFLKQKTDGKAWSQVISDANQNQGEIEQKLARIEQAMKDAK